ncbi:GerAB/ArcD/ProY family transporter [Mobilitalea sibirica]|uniref:GerAB/ArcD/ProY family transporter n=1 Tax=Mobilitalea sibirica TaxID=1462919 RepID=A0A8J7HDZ2_9FIRM|nr:GerAB/ArcD/ProY family transporter [Mobilitalea sibirica]MBH1941389.1 GerAB/ArcD/ProY family transporter [Mobilitalea sibirica]
MNKEVSIRQIAYTYLFLSLSPILRQIPSALAGEAGKSGYLSPLWSVLVILPLTGIVIILLREFPGLSFYEIMEQLIGRFLAKLIILSYLIWILLSITAKINAYSLTMQFTLMPHTRSNFFMVILIILVFHALMRGMKTIFRFSEFTLGPILVLFGILFFCALTRLRMDYLLPVSTINLPTTMTASKNVIAVGGNIIIVLFFADKLGITISKQQMRKLWYAAVVFIVLSFVITIFTFGITGADLATNLPFPFYITVKSISFFNIFERFEVLITLICILSDFIAVCVSAIILYRCFMWLFQLTEIGYLFVPLAMIVYYLTYFISSTQFEFDFLYRYFIVNSNMIFQYIIPALIGIIGLLKRKKIAKQY